MLASRRRLMGRRSGGDAGDREIIAAWRRRLGMRVLAFALGGQWAVLGYPGVSVGFRAALYAPCR